MKRNFEEALKQLDYDPDSGVFRWVKKPAKRCSSGDIAGSLSKNGYWQITVAGRTYMAHRLAWLKVYGSWPEHQIDHINCIRTDNRIVNLRASTSSQNMHNPLRMKSKNKTSQYLGVSFIKGKGKWVAQIKVLGKRRFLGYHDTEESAFRAYSLEKSRVLKEIGVDEAEPKQADLILPSARTEPLEVRHGQ